MNEHYIDLGVDADNPDTHQIIEVRGKRYSVFQGQEQETANSIAQNLP